MRLVVEPCGFTGLFPALNHNILWEATLRLVVSGQTVRFIPFERINSIQKTSLHHAVNGSFFILQS